MGREIKAGTHIVILGGGTAGWITANALIASWGGKGVEVTLIESPDIGTVGVGEGSTPRLKHFFNAIGVDESEWMPKCNATYKNGITFANWTNKPGFEHYYHPFPARTDEHTTGAFYINTLLRRRGEDVHAHPDRFFLSARLSEERRGPIPNESFPFEIEYGYHFDANLVAEFLRNKAISKGVQHVQCKVQGVNQSATGDIESLITDSEDTIDGDFFIDCSGFAGALIQQTLEVPFHSFAENLFNDAAVVLPTQQMDDIASQTVSTALKHGWAWEIPLTHRIGNGYVYSSAFCSADAAETELRETLGLLESDTEARHLEMKVGRVENHWERNCLAIGLSQG
ncbi:MAG: tryptophan halogenase family protein, partial [Woeseiaceae bacterium]